LRRSLPSFQVALGMLELGQFCVVDFDLTMLT
jgi:hypothetical protein